MPPNEVNASDPRVVRTRKLIQDAFTELLTSKDFEAITVQDISGKATVNRATFYAHYEDKYDLAENLVRERFKARLTAEVPVSSAVSEATLQTLIKTVLDYVAEAYGHCRLERQFGALLESALHDTLQDFIVDWLQRSASPALSSRPAMDTAALVVSAALIRAGIRWCRAGQKERSSELARQVVAVLGPGVIGPARTASPRLAAVTR